MSSKLQKIMVFSKVCETQSIVQTAREFELPERAVVEIISDLESEAGEKLLVASGEKFEATEVGKMILASAQAVIALFEPPESRT
jgi:DNA-binding transcriptional LysR family regulator